VWCGCGGGGGGGGPRVEGRGSVNALTCVFEIVSLFSMGLTQRRACAPPPQHHHRHHPGPGAAVLADGSVSLEAAGVAGAMLVVRWES